MAVKILPKLEDVDTLEAKYQNGERSPKSLFRGSYDSMFAENKSSLWVDTDYIKMGSGCEYQEFFEPQRFGAINMPKTTLGRVSEVHKELKEFNTECLAYVDSAYQENENSVVIVRYLPVNDVDGSTIMKFLAVHNTLEPIDLDILKPGHVYQLSDEGLVLGSVDKENPAVVHFQYSLADKTDSNFVEKENLETVVNDFVRQGYFKGLLFDKVYAEELDIEHGWRSSRIVVDILDNDGNVDPVPLIYLFDVGLLG